MFVFMQFIIALWYNNIMICLEFIIILKRK